MHEGEFLESLIKEYEGILRSLKPEEAGAKPEMKAIVELLQESGDWTGRGAGQIVRLVRKYGAFMLRNALALAVVLREEDGELGF